MPAKKQLKVWSPPETKYFGGDMYDLLNEGNGYESKAEAEKLAREWKVYPKDAKARVLKIKGLWWVYGN